MKRVLLQLLITVGALFGSVWALWFVSAEYEDWRYIRPWQRVQRGDTEQRVVELLGRPHRVILEHSDKAAWQFKDKIEWYDAESVKSFRYVPFSITGEAYEVSFDSSGHAVSKYHITSP